MAFDRPRAYDDPQERRTHDRRGPQEAPDEHFPGSDDPPDDLPRPGDRLDLDEPEFDPAEFDPPDDDLPRPSDRLDLDEPEFDPAEFDPPDDWPTPQQASPYIVAERPDAVAEYEAPYRDARSVEATDAHPDTRIADTRQAIRAADIQPATVPAAPAQAQANLPQSTQASEPEPTVATAPAQVSSSQPTQAPADEPRVATAPDQSQAPTHVTTAPAQSQDPAAPPSARGYGSGRWAAREAGWIASAQAMEAKAIAEIQAAQRVATPPPTGSAAVHSTQGGGRPGVPQATNRKQDNQRDR